MSMLECSCVEPRVPDIYSGSQRIEKAKIEGAYTSGMYRGIKAGWRFLPQTAEARGGGT
jgi:hypothetical protein